MSNKMDDIKALTTSTEIYDYLVNNLHELPDDKLNQLVETLEKADHSGQYLTSAARYINGIDSFKYKMHIDRLVQAVIDKDHERKFLADLTASIYGADYEDRVEEFEKDHNFRRLYKRLHPGSSI